MRAEAKRFVKTPDLMRGHERNRRARLTSAYHDLGQQLVSGKLNVIGNYTLQRTIGQGAFGKVRLATHRLTNVRVAVKQIPKHYVACLTREIHHHRRLQHPNVLQLFEVIQSENYIWMITELCSQGELYNYLLARGRVDENEARSIFGQLCLAVAYIHGCGIVHRDLKLENILLDESKQVKLSDFGFTRECETHQLLSTKCGTTAYSPPEILLGEKYLGFEVDVWSLGVILFALLCGYLPFDDENEARMQEKIVRDAIEVPNSLSNEARDLLSCLLEKDPTLRPSLHNILLHPWFKKVQTSTQESIPNFVNYFELLSRPRPPLFESAEEQRIFKQLQELGFAVGQIRHSVLTNACDSASALWWLLLRRMAARCTNVSSTEAVVRPNLSTSKLDSSNNLDRFENQSYQASRASVQPYLKEADGFQGLLSSDAESSTSSISCADSLSYLPADVPMTPSAKHASLPSGTLFNNEEATLNSSFSHHSATELTALPSRSLGRHGRRTSTECISSIPLHERQHSWKLPRTSRRHRSFESFLYRQRLPLYLTAENTETPVTPRKGLKTISRKRSSRPGSLDELTMESMSQQLHTLGLRRASTSSSPEKLSVPRTVFVRHMRSAFGNSPVSPLPASASPRPRLRPLSRRHEGLNCTACTPVDACALVDEEDWIDEENYAGGIGQGITQLPMVRTRRGSPCPPRMQSLRHTERRSTTARKFKSNTPAPVIEEEDS